jgi:hypothetical protein
MVTVPAQSFRAPTRSPLIAAARCMPGVWAVLVSSASPGTTRTPPVRQSGAGSPLARMASQVCMTATLRRDRPVIDASGGGGQ